MNNQEWSLERTPVIKTLLRESRNVPNENKKAFRMAAELLASRQYADQLGIIDIQTILKEDYFSNPSLFSPDTDNDIFHDNDIDSPYKILILRYFEKWKTISQMGRAGLNMAREKWQFTIFKNLFFEI